MSFMTDRTFPWHGLTKRGTLLERKQHKWRWSTSRTLSSLISHFTAIKKFQDSAKELIVFNHVMMSSAQPYALRACTVPGQKSSQEFSHRVIIFLE
jgi:hypothetical protein